MNILILIAPLKNVSTHFEGALLEIYRPIEDERISDSASFDSSHWDDGKGMVIGDSMSSGHRSVRAFEPIAKQGSGRVSLVSHGSQWYLLKVIEGYSTAEKSVADIEEEAKVLLEDEVDKLPFEDLTMLWVNRTLIVSEEEPKGWIRGRSCALQEEEQARLACSSAVFGWGNNCIVAESALDERQMKAIILGIIDAQSFWIEADSLHDRVLESEGALSEGGGSAKARDFMAKSNEMFNEYARIRVVRGKYLSRAQGLRYSVSTCMLEAWRFNELCSSTAEHIAEIEQLAERKRNESSRVFQNVIEVVLFAIGALALIQFMFDLFEVSYSGPTGTVVTFMQGASFDIWFAIFTMAALMLLLFYVVSYRKR